MKKIIFLHLSFITLTVTAQTVNIPDPEFLKVLIKKGVDINNDGNIQTSEAEVIENLYLSGKLITDLTGIESFSSLKILECYSNQINKLDITKNISLQKLWCGYNQITSLDVSNNLALTDLVCPGNQLTTLNITSNKALHRLICGQNKLTSLDITNNIALDYLNCGENFLTSLDLTKNIALKELWCHNNQLSVIDFSKNISLESINCFSCNLTSLDISKNKNLEDLDCHGNLLSDISDMVFADTAHLYRFNCGNNLFKTLNFTRFISFYDFDCRNNNQLTHLDISKINVYYFNCTGNPNLFKICISNSQVTRITERDKPTEPGQEIGFLIWTKDNQASYTTDCSVSVSEINKSTIKPKLLNVYNLIGQEVSPEQLKEGVYIYRYSDGSTKRIWNTGSN